MSGRAGQALFLEFNKDDPADNTDKFIYGGLANQPTVARYQRFGGCGEGAGCIAGTGSGFR